MKNYGTVKNVAKKKREVDYFKTHYTQSQFIVPGPGSYNVKEMAKDNKKDLKGYTMRPKCTPNPDHHLRKTPGPNAYGMNPLF